MSFTCEHCGSTVSCLSQVGRDAMLPMRGHWLEMAAQIAALRAALINARDNLNEECASEECTRGDPQRTFMEINRVLEWTGGA